ncbi:maf: septum formation protein maf [Lucifera butyrica]|uniref:dTTP/UTP pyrophosphatase n=1 Tax=Lucifera butyrica TaxID=1351585 RepID=A0A498RA92_9FIRM|nr:Maf family protein [Lucifera butyrica]VBB07860.1 maf: septum formation protein maf [Lucifera butyrica]
MAIILASASPRRQELLTQIRCNFTVVTSNVIEDNTQAVPPEKLAVIQAVAKARDVAARAGRNDVVIGADTIVVYNGQIYGKPADRTDARRMLTELSGHEHCVITGVAVVGNSQTWSDFACTKVTLRDLTDEEIEHYLATGEPMDKAGAYGIQGIGALLVANISGSYSNVVGLPLVTLAELLKKAGIKLL